MIERHFGKKTENNNQLKLIHFNIDKVENLKALKKLPRNLYAQI